MTVENPRLRLLLGTQWRLIVAVLVVVALASFGAAATGYGEQPTEVVTQETNRQTVTTETSHRATVVTGDSLWPRGTVLADKPVYLLNATPSVNVSARTTVDGASAARVRHVWSLTLTASAGEDPFYTETRTLANVTRRSTTATSSVVLDVPAVRDRIATIRNKTEGIAAVTATLSLRVDYCTDPSGGCRYAETNAYSTPVSTTGRSYSVDGEMGGSTDHSTTAESEVPQPRDWGRLAGLALLGLLSLGLAGGVVSVGPRDIDVEQARHDLHRTRYEEWISPGVIPMGISQQFVELETIEDVVDVAIDTNERVVYDRRRDLYAVISENVVYYFSTGGSWMESAFRGMQFGGEGAPDADGPFAGGPDAEGPFGGPPGDGDQSAGEFGFPDEDEAPFGDGGDDGDGDEAFPGGDGADEGPFAGGDGEPFDEPGDDGRD